MTVEAEGAALEDTSPLDWSVPEGQEEWHPNNPQLELFEESEEEESEEEVVEEEDGTIEDYEESEEDYEESEEDYEESEEEEEESFEEEEEEEEEIDWQELTDSLKGKNDNLNKALHAERTKRKEASDKLTSLEAELSMASTYKETLEAYKAKVKELDLEEVIDIKEPAAIDPRLQQLLDAQKVADSQAKQFQTVKTMQETVVESLGNYKNIDSGSDVQGSILGKLIMTDVNNGADMDDAVKSALSTLDALLSTTKKAVKATRKPAVKTKSKPPARTTQSRRKVDPRQRAVIKGEQTGDFKDLFAQMGARMAGAEN